MERLPSRWRRRVLFTKPVKASRLPCPRDNAGFTLIEMIVFIVVISSALGAMVMAFGQSSRNSIDPIVNIRMLEIAQSQLDEVLARKYDEDTPTGGVPACIYPCSGAFGPDGVSETGPATYDDVDDFHLDVSDPDYTDGSGYSWRIDVSDSGADLPNVNGAAAQAKRIEITVTAPTGNSLSLSAYKVNF